MAAFEKLVALLQDQHHPMRERAFVRLGQMSGVIFRECITLVKSISSTIDTSPDIELISAFCKMLKDPVSVTVSLVNDYRPDDGLKHRDALRYGKKFRISAEFVLEEQNQSKQLYGDDGLVDDWCKTVRLFREHLTNIVSVFTENQESSPTRIVFTLEGRLKNIPVLKEFMLSSGTYLAPEFDFSIVRNYVNFESFIQNVAPKGDHHLLLYANLVKFPDTDPDVSPGLSEERPWIVQLLLMSRHKSWVGNFSVAVGPSDMRNIENVLYELAPNNPVFELGQKVAFFKEQT